MSKELMENIVKALDKKKARDIKVIKISDLTTVADYFVIASGTSSTQVKALADEVEFKLGQLGYHVVKEGYQSANWILLDYKDVVVHIFYGETREYYNLEKLWNDGENIDINYLLEEN